MLLYKFFDYKYNIEGFTSDLFSTAHIVYIFLAVVSVVIFSILFRNAEHKKIDIFLKVLSIFMAVMEIVKITWESSWDIKTGRGFNYGGLLPLYTCSLFIYTLLIVAWGKKGSVWREYSLSFIGTIGLLCGFIGVIYCNGLNWYPFWTFGAWYSLMFHYLMFATGVFVLATRFKKLEWKDIFRGWVPMLFLAFFSIPACYEYGADYMSIYSGDGVPLLENLAQALSSIHFRWVYTFIALCSYMIVSLIVVSIYKLVEYIISKNKLQQNLENNKTAS